MTWTSMCTISYDMIVMKISILVKPLITDQSPTSNDLVE
jgi:hypothetical protein